MGRTFGCAALLTIEMISAVQRGGDAGDFAFLWAWELVTPREVGQLLAHFNRPWWIAGGWAVDLFLAMRLDVTTT